MTTSRTSSPSPTRRAVGAVLAALLLASAATAQAERNFNVLASGERGRTYFDLYAPNLILLLPAYQVKSRETSGSIENLDLLASGKADIGFAQADVYAAQLRADPTRYQGLTVIGRLADECLYIAHRADGPIQTLSALGGLVDARKPKIAVGPAGGGMSGTWSFLTTLDTSLAGAQVVDTGGTLALNQLSIGMLDAVGWITDPLNLQHVLLRAVQANPELALLSIIDPKLEHALADETRIYRLENVALGQKRDARRHRTLCTSSMIFARPAANPRLVEAVSEVLSLKRETLVRPR